MLEFFPRFKVDPKTIEYIENYSNQVFKNFLRAVFFVLIFYGLLFFSYDSRFLYNCTLVCLIVFLPINYYLNSINKFIFSRLFFIFWTNFLVAAADLGLGATSAADYYFFAAITFPFLVFDRMEKWPIFCSLGMTISIWVITHLWAADLFPAHLIATNIPVKVFQTVNFLGTTALISIFLTTFLNHRRQLKKLLVNSLRKESENDKVANQQMALAQSISRTGSWHCNLKTKEQFWSSEHYKIFEIPEPQPQDELFKMYRERIHPEDRPELDRIMESSMRTGEGFQYHHRVFLDNGQRIKFVIGTGIVTKDSNGKPEFISGTCQDITEIKNLELESTSILKTMSEGLVIQNSTGAIEKFNPAALSILGVSEEQLLGKTCMDPQWKTIKEDGDPFPGDEHPAMIALKTKKPVLDVIIGISANNNSIRWIQVNAIPFQTADGTKAAVTFANVTEIVNNRDRIKSLEEKYQFILKSMGIGIWKYFPATQDLQWDRSMYDLYEINESNFSGHFEAWETCLSKEARETAVNELNQALAGEKDFNTTFEIQTKNGIKKHLGGKAVVIRDEKSQTIKMFGINWDRTKDVLAEETIRIERAKALHNAKLASLGEMSASIAHEINNPLAVIAGNVDLLLKFKYDDNKFMVRSEKILKATERIEKIVKGLRKFARTTNKIERKVENLAEIISEVIVITELKSKLFSTIVKTEIGPDLFIYCDSVEIEQVIVNLVNNSIDAIKNTKTRWVEVKANLINDKIVISITDSGFGIPIEVEQKMFEPFYTTKEVGEGTGLGLSIVKGILDDHNATISLNRSGPNTCFELSFPSAAIAVQKSV